MKDFCCWVINEGHTRYSVEVNYRTKTSEVLSYAAKLILGFVSAALKKMDYSVKKIFDDEPYRIIVSSRHWDDGEWVCIVSWNPHKRSFVISRGFYNKMRKTVSVKEQEVCHCESASELTSYVKEIMEELKEKPNRHIEKLKRVPLKRGPK